MNPFFQNKKTGELVSRCAGDIAAIRLPMEADLAGEIMRLIGRAKPEARMEQRGEWVFFFGEKEENASDPNNQDKRQKR